VGTAEATNTMQQIYNRRFQPEELKIRIVYFGLCYWMPNLELSSSGHCQQPA
jgi:hypothetical protein